MTSRRNEFDIRFDLSPRIAILKSPANNITVQDLHDTLRDIEQEPQNLIYPSLISSAGKEDLGGGVSVGITTTLQDAKLAFQANKVWDKIGTVTTPDTTGATLIDSGATFISDGIQVGAWVVNFTDQSIASVFQVVSETEILTDTLGGTVSGNNQFNLDDSYGVVNVLQNEIDGGNLVAIDVSGVSVDSILPTAGNQVVRTSSSSATLQELSSIQYSSYQNHVWIDTTGSVTGTQFPTGTPQAPVNNFVDAVAIAQEKGFIRLRLVSNATLNSGDNVEGLTIVGENPLRTTITVNSGALTQGAEFHDTKVVGVFDNQSSFFSCVLEDLDFIEALIEDCQLNGIIKASGNISVINCWDGSVQSAPPPTIDFNHSGASLAVRDYHGDLTLKNKSGAGPVEINYSSGGTLTLESTVSAGSIRLSGIMQVVDNSTGTADVNSTYVIYPEAVQLAAFNSKVSIDTVAGTTGTKFPIGTPQYPVNNITDAITIAIANGFDTFSVVGTLVVTGNISNLTFEGLSPGRSVIVLMPGCITFATEFSFCLLTGQVNGPIVVSRAGVQALTNLGDDNIDSFFTESMLIDAGSSSLTLRSGLSTPKPVHLIQCYSSGSETSPSIDFNNTALQINLREFAGELSVKNYTGGQTSVFDIATGKITVDSTCTNGNLTLRGTASLIDNSTGTFSIDSTAMINTGSLTLYEWVSS
jgi:hypothetical protein